MSAHTPYLTDEQRHRFWTDGYLVLKQILEPEVVENGRNAILDMIPRDLVLPDYYHTNHGRIKPQNPDNNHSMYIPELLPMLQNEALYRAAVDILETEYLKTSDGSVGVTIRDTGRTGRIQNLHLDVHPQASHEITPEHLKYGVGIGGCYYLSQVEENGGGIHVVPGAPNKVMEIMLNEADGPTRHDNWGNIADFPPSIEVTADAGDFVLMHHLMPHCASANHRNIPRVVQFTRIYTLSDEEAVEAPGADRAMSPEALAALTPLGRKMFRMDPWII